MKYIKFILILVLAAALLCGCGAELKKEDITGTWIGTGTAKQNTATQLLEIINLCDVEKDFVDLNTLKYQKCVKFTEKGKYIFSLDVEASKHYVREFYEGVMAALYENRKELNEVYSVVFDDMTQDEFYQFYADMYNFADYEMMITAFVERAYDYDKMAEKRSRGKFTIDGPVLVCTPEGAEKETILGCEVDGDTMKLLYTNSVEIYTFVE